MDEHKLEELLSGLERFGLENDAQVGSRSLKMRNITRETGEFLLLLLRAVQARRVLEIGTSNGYSTLWLARAVQPLSGRVTTIDHAADKVEMARRNLETAQMQSQVEQVQAEAGEWLIQQRPATFDFIFLDSERDEYLAWWEDLRRVLAPGRLLVVDNAFSHEEELKPFVQAVQATPGYITTRVDVGKGEFLVLKPME
jgi:predicted O-methyltransferase YrrM